MLKQISVEQLKDEALVLSKVHMFHQSHNVVFIVRVLIHEEPEQLSFLLRELVVDLCVSIYLHRNFHAMQVVNR